MKTKFFAGGLVAVAAALVAAAALGAFSSGTHNAKGASRAASANIALHGHWTIQIRDHGHVVRTVRFHNELTATGIGELTSILSHQRGITGWMIELFGNPTPCGGRSACDIGEPQVSPSTLNGAGVYNLTVSPITNGFELKGTATPDVDTTINQVWTVLVGCNRNTAQSSCSGTVGTQGIGQVTSRALSPGIPVSAGQQILAKADLTLSP